MWDVSCGLISSKQAVISVSALISSDRRNGHHRSGVPPRSGRSGGCHPFYSVSPPCSGRSSPGCGGSCRVSTVILVRIRGFH